MKNKFYGNCIQNILKHEVDAYVEEIRLKGFAVIEGFLAEKELSVIRGKIDAVYRIQEDELGKDYLSEIGELNIARALLVYDDYFLNLITQDKVLETLKKLLGDYLIQHFFIFLDMFDHIKDADHIKLIPKRNVPGIHLKDLSAFHFLTHKGKAGGVDFTGTQAHIRESGSHTRYHKPGAATNFKKCFHAREITL